MNACPSTGKVPPRHAGGQAPSECLWMQIMMSGNTSECTAESISTSM